MRLASRTRAAAATQMRSAPSSESWRSTQVMHSRSKTWAPSICSAAANDPRSSRARAGLGVVALRAGRRDEAIAHWQQAVALDRTNFDALYNVGTELVNAGRHVE